jgi:hypothetical protein
MRSWIAVACVAAGVAAADAAEPTPGRTDGLEGSEIGRGGYPHHATESRLFLEPFFGAAAVDIEPEGGFGNTSETDLLYGLNVGYLMEDWLGVQAGYGYIAGDQKTSLYMVGVRNILQYDPFNYYLRLDAELFSPDVGDSYFGIVPGVGAEVIISDRLRAGLQYQHDFIFSDDNISVNRFTARLKVRF